MDCLLLVIFKQVYVSRTTTPSMMMNLISSRDFVDLIVNDDNELYVGTIGK